MDTYQVIIQGEKVYAPASIVIDLRAQLAESERRRVELVEAVRPVVAWWEIENPIGIYNSSDKILQAVIECGSKTKYALVTASQLGALAALVGEEGR